MSQLSDVYVYITEEAIDRTVEVEAGVLIDYTADGEVVGVEVIDALRTEVNGRVVRPRMTREERDAGLDARGRSARAYYKRAMTEAAGMLERSRRAMRARMGGKR